MSGLVLGDAPECPDIGMVRFSCKKNICRSDGLVVFFLFGKDETPVIPHPDIGGIDLTCLFKGSKRLVVLSQVIEGDPLVIECLGIIGHDFYRLVIGGDRFRMPPEVRKCNSLVVIDLGMARVHHERMVVGADRFLEPAQFIQGNSLEDPAFCIVNFQRKEPFTYLEGFFISPYLGKRGSFIV